LGSRQTNWSEPAAPPVLVAQRSAFFEPDYEGGRGPRRHRLVRRRAEPCRGCRRREPG
jgi:hypothetical protein